jgi:tryptophan synthase alpha chain
MKRKDKFTELKTRGEGALIAYICAGDHTPNATTQIMHALVSGGADTIELRLPFSPTIADDSTIQASIKLTFRRSPSIFHNFY